MSGVVEQLFREWQSLQPLKPEDQRRLDEKFRLEFNYNSNHIEGNTLTYGQTKLLLIFDQTDGNHDMREFEEMKAHDVALRMVIQEAKDQERPLTEQFIRLLNETILVRPFWKNAQTPDGQHTRMEVKIGEYKSRPNHVRTATGEIFQYASETETPAMMQDLVEWYNKVSKEGLLTPVELAALLHYRFIRIHPFEDGNGRVARLLVNFVLFRHGYPMLIVQTKDKNNYLRTLNRCDVAVGLEPVQGANASLDKIRPFVDYLEKELIHSLEICIKAAKGESIEEEDDFEKKLSLLEKKLKQSESEKPGFKSEYVWDIIERFYYPFVNRFQESLSPLSRFFEYNDLKCLVDGKSFKISEISFLKNKEKSPRDKSYYRMTGLDLIADKTDFENPQKLEFNFSVTLPASQKLRNVSILFNLSINFKSDLYYVESSEFYKEYTYVNFPSNDDVEILINNFRNDVLKQIDKAIK